MIIVRIDQIVLYEILFAAWGLCNDSYLVLYNLLVLRFITTFFRKLSPSHPFNQVQRTNDGGLQQKVQPQLLFSWAQAVRKTAERYLTTTIHKPHLLYRESLFMEMACINLFQCMNIFFHWRYAEPKVRYSRSRTLYYVPLNSCEKKQVGARCLSNFYEWLLCCCFS